MSTLKTIETNDRNLILADLYPLSDYFISISVCNYFDCGPSSSAIRIKIPSSSKTSIMSFSSIESFSFSSDVHIPIRLSHPINKPLIIDCFRPNSWFYKYDFSRIKSSDLLKNNF